MAGGPLDAYSVYPATVTGEVFADVYTAAGANSPDTVGWGLEASLGADATLGCKFRMPPSLPTGTAKLVLTAQADAATGAVKVNPKWRSVAIEEDPSDTALNAEGTSTLTWATGDEDVLKELKVTLDADTVVAGEIIVMDLVFETSGTTLAQLSVWNFSIIWE